MLVDPVKFRSRDGVELRGILVLPKKEAVACAVLAHGITVEKNEGGFYTKLANRLAKDQMATLRFDFRGHGESGGSSETMTIAGEQLDLAAAVAELRARYSCPLSVVGTSFGAGVAVLYADTHPSKLTSLTLLCPVLDYRRTFLDPRTEWTEKWFGGEAISSWESQGELNLDGFRLGAQLLKEFRKLEPYRVLERLKVPSLIIHGTEDSMVPFEIARDAARAAPRARFVPVQGADHGFEGTEETVFDEVSAWILSCNPRG